jgi:hypothetical protein
MFQPRGLDKAAEALLGGSVRSDRFDGSLRWNILAVERAAPAGARLGIGPYRGDDWNRFRHESAEFGATGDLPPHGDPGTGVSQKAHTIGPIGARTPANHLSRERLTARFCTRPREAPSTAA